VVLAQTDPRHGDLVSEVSVETMMWIAAVVIEADGEASWMVVWTGDELQVEEGIETSACAVDYVGVVGATVDYVGAVDAVVGGTVDVAVGVGVGVGVADTVVLVVVVQSVAA